MHIFGFGIQLFCLNIVGARHPPKQWILQISLWVTPVCTNMTLEITIFNRKYIFKWWIFHCPVSLRVGTALNHPSWFYWIPGGVAAHNHKKTNTSAILWPGLCWGILQLQWQVPPIPVRKTHLSLSNVWLLASWWLRMVGYPPGNRR